MENTGTMEKIETVGDVRGHLCAEMMCTHECTKMDKLHATSETMNAARRTVDKATRKCDKMAVYVAQMQGARDFYANLMICKEEEKAEAEKNFLVYNKLLSDAHTEWTSALECQAELWEAYNISRDEYMKESAVS